MLEVEDPFALRPSEDLDSMGQEGHFSVKTFSRQKWLDSEKMKFCEFISIPQIVELGKREKRKCFTETFSKQNVSEVSFLGPVFGFRTSFSFSKKIKFLKKYLKHLSKQQLLSRTEICFFQDFIIC